MRFWACLQINPYDSYIIYIYIYSYDVFFLPGDNFTFAGPNAPYFSMHRKSIDRFSKQCRFLQPHEFQPFQNCPVLKIFPRPVELEIIEAARLDYCTSTKVGFHGFASTSLAVERPTFKWQWVGRKILYLKIQGFNLSKLPAAKDDFGGPSGNQTWQWKIPYAWRFE